MAGPENSTAGPRLPLLLLALVTLVLYLPVRQHGWIPYDDAEYLTENRIVQAGLTWAGIKWAFTTFHASLWIPVTWLSHMLDCTLFGLDPAAHHVMNMLLHTTNALLFFWVFWRMTGALWPVFFAAAFFAWHPLRVESVAWAAERKDLLAAFFGLLAIWAYARHAGGGKADFGSGAGETAGSQGRSPLPRPGEAGSQGRSPLPEFGRWYWLALLFFALGLMSKPMLVTLPFVLMLLDIWPLGRLPLNEKLSFQGAWRLAWEKWPFLVLTIAISVVTAIAARSEAISAGEYGLGARVGNAMLVYGRYLWKTVLPVDLAIIYPLPAQVAWGRALAAALLLGLISWWVWRVRRVRPWWLVGWLWLLGMLVPVIGLVQVGPQAMADRFTYLPLMGLALAVAFEGGYWRRRLQWPMAPVAVFSALVLAGYCFATKRQLGLWEDSVKLFEHTLAVTGPNAAAHANLGVALEQQGRAEEARQQYEAALQLMPNLAQVHNNLANLLDAAGEKEQALDHYREAVRLKPGSALAHMNLGSALVDRGNYQEGLRQYAEANRLVPRDPRPSHLSARAHLRQGRTAEAIVGFREALQRDPNDLASLLLLARLLATHPDATVRDGTEALRLAEHANALSGGENPTVLDTLAMALAESGRFDEARGVAAEALRRLESAGDTDAAAALTARMQLYSSNQPFREDFSGPARP